MDGVFPFDRSLTVAYAIVSAEDEKLIICVLGPMVVILFCYSCDLEWLTFIQNNNHCQEIIVQNLMLWLDFHHSNIRTVLQPLSPNICIIYLTYIYYYLHIYFSMSICIRHFYFHFQINTFLEYS